MMVTIEALLEQYYEVTRQALEAVRQDQTDRLEECLNRRDQLIRQMDGQLPSSDGRAVGEPLWRLAARIRELDQELIAALDGKRDEIRKKIGAIQQGKQLRRQYAPDHGFAEGIFFDKRK